MKLIAQTPKDSSSDILQKYKPVDTDFDKFKTHLQTFIDKTDVKESEEHLKNNLRDAERPLINASVLGKVFEKINGYKDGSIYTPGFITMYMCRQAIRLAVVQKFNESYTDWRIETFAGLKNRLAILIKIGYIFCEIADNECVSAENG